nr:PREDICTED: uncharacterized protein LOC107076407 [Lepisosteus oculatus]XP_015195520.1 PREDICTED: uncharacterized protein LOC107076408 [Lepisosteus oculatus]
MSKTTLTNFYPNTVQSVLAGGIAVWYGGATVQDRKAIQRAERSAQKIPGTGYISTAAGLELYFGTQFTLATVCFHPWVPPHSPTDPARRLSHDSQRSHDAGADWRLGAAARPISAPAALFYTKGVERGCRASQLSGSACGGSPRTAAPRSHREVRRYYYCPHSDLLLLLLLLLLFLTPVSLGLPGCEAGTPGDGHIDTTGNKEYTRKLKADNSWNSVWERTLRAWDLEGTGEGKRESGHSVCSGSTCTPDPPGPATPLQSSPVQSGRMALCRQVLAVCLALLWTGQPARPQSHEGKRPAVPHVLVPPPAALRSACRLCDLVALEPTLPRAVRIHLPPPPGGDLAPSRKGE